MLINTTYSYFIPALELSFNLSAIGGIKVLTPGEILNHEFLVEKVLKRGGMSVVYLGKQGSLRRDVVIKMLSPQGTALSPGEMESLFEKEANMLASLNHQQIPRVYSYFRHNSSYCLVMEYIPGETLADRLSKKKLPLPVEEVLELGCELCEVLWYLHSRSPQIVFRDLKPENIILQGKTPYLIDFGIARAFDFKRARDTHCLGTEGYAPPEQYKGESDHRSDIYALGRLLFLLVTGQAPEKFPGHKPLESLSRYNSSLPKEFESIIVKCAQPDRSLRYQTVMSLRNDLEKMYLIKTTYEKCNSCGTPLLEGHSLCSCCGAMKPLESSGPPQKPSKLSIKEDPVISQKVSQKSPGLFSYGASYYLAEFFGRTLGFDSLITIEHNKVEEMPHQLKVIKRVLKTMRGRALLADEVGLGKTIEAGLIMEELRARGLVRRVLIIVPSHLTDQWREEMRDKFERDFFVYKSGEYSPEILFREKSIIIPIDTAARNEEVKASLLKQDWDMIIVDEAHFAKNRTTKRWKMLHSLRKHYILLLTATPLHNDLLELFNLITLLRPGHLRDERDFVARYVDKKDRRRPRNVDQLKELLSEVMVRTRRASALVKFPQREAQTLKVEPSSEELSLYQEATAFIRSLSARQKIMRKLALMMLQQRLTSSPMAIAESIGNLLQSENWNFTGSECEMLSRFQMKARAITRPSKASRLLSLITTLNEKVVLFTDHVPTQEYLRRFLAENRIPCSLYRGTNQEKLTALREFAEPSQVLIVSKAGSEGLNLHHFSRSVVNYDLPWNPMRLEQRIGRLQRIGQKKKVLVFNLSLRGTIEDVILEILEKKVKLFELAIGQIDLILGLSFEDKNFDDLIWNILIESKGEAEVRETLYRKLGDKLEQGGRMAGEINASNVFLPHLDDD
ncbi:MAG: SNF2-related protein [Candidatus Eremiobacteraeota bacterium]|nr:SNF2-related protein [Candidatus Eremiobacteraeota bacterium]